MCSAKMLKTTYTPAEIHFLQLRLPKCLQRALRQFFSFFFFLQLHQVKQAENQDLLWKLSLQVHDLTPSKEMGWRMEPKLQSFNTSFPKERNLEDALLVVGKVSQFTFNLLPVRISYPSPTNLEIPKLCSKVGTTLIRKSGTCSGSYMELSTNYSVCFPGL